MCLQWQQADTSSSPRPVAMLASSRDGEEHLLHSLQWLVVPRHPQRFDAVATCLPPLAGKCAAARIVADLQRRGWL